MAFKTLDTLTQYQEITDYCFALYKNKLKDYGCAWRVLRLPSLTDQIYIKANRIRTIENTGVQKVDEGIESELIAIVNYSIIALIQLDHGVSDDVDMNTEQAEEAYLHHKQIVEQLLQWPNSFPEKTVNQIQQERSIRLICMKNQRHHWL